MKYRKMRCGSTTEIVVAMALLLVGSIPLMRMFGTSRGDLGDSREAVRLQSAAFLLLDEAVGDAGAGRWGELEPGSDWSEDRVIDGGWSPLASSLRVERDPTGLLLATVHLESGNRFFELTEVLDGEGAQ